jgi:hypothetical protein
LLACQLNIVDIYRAGYPRAATVSAARLLVAKLPSANDRHLLRKMPTVIEMLQTFTSDVDCPTGATGLKAYLPVMTELLPEGRRRITPDSTSAAHVREFARVLKLAMDVDPDEFAKAIISRASGVANRFILPQTGFRHLAGTISGREV